MFTLSIRVPALCAWARWLFGWLPLAGLVAKIFYELNTGSALFVADPGEGVVPLPSAHLAGLVVGVVWFLLTINPSSKKKGLSWRVFERIQ